MGDKTIFPLSSLPKEWADGGLAKAAGSSVVFAGWDDEDAPDEAGGEEEQNTSPLKELEDKIIGKILSKARQRIEKDLEDSPAGESNSSMAPNDTLQRESRDADKQTYLIGLQAIVDTSTKPADLINRVATYNNHHSILFPVEFYRTALKLGSTTKYDNLTGYLSACTRALGRKPSLTEAKALIRLGKLISHTD